MCGRFSLTADRQALLDEFDLTDVPADYTPRYNIAPTQAVVALAPQQGGRVEAVRLRWGLVPAWAKDPSVGSRLINARAETLAEKPSFKGPLARQRCAILADGFFEWQQAGRQKVPLYFHLKTRRPFAFAGLWDRWRPADGDWIRTCTIVTTAANPLVAPVHDRMPVILPADALAAWLDPALQDPVALQGLLTPLPAELLDVYPVSNLVNSPANNMPACVERAKQ